MAKHVSLGKKIGLGFSIIICLTIVVGMAGFFAMQRVVSGSGLLLEMDTIQRDFESAKEWVDTYLLNGYDEGRNTQTKAEQSASGILKKEIGSIRNIRRHPFVSKLLKQDFAHIEKAIDGYAGGFKKYTQAEVKKAETAGEIRTLFSATLSGVKEGSFMVENMLTKTEIATAAGHVYLDRNTDMRWEKLQDALVDQEMAVNEWYEKMNNSGELRAKGDEIKKTVLTLRQRLDDYHDAVMQQEKSRVTMTTHKTRLNKLFRDISAQTAKKLKRVVVFSNTVILLFIGVSLLLGALFAILSTRSIVKNIRRIIQTLSVGANQVVSASDQVASASQQLAEGSAKQAASIQETSASLEEMASMTKKNAENAEQSNALMDDTAKVVNRASGSMKALVSAMEEVSKSNEETQKIVKTIDEIAFQTNLLALNAAVEAARAGEAGAGFAVVADEVRNLAIRSAEAAKNTTLLIENTVAKVKESTKVVSETDSAFTTVVDETDKIGRLIAEIAAASQEQSRGIDQINKAVLEIDRVTLQSASSAEESASASEEMNAQSAQMQTVVKDLATLIGGGKGQKKKRTPPGAGITEQSRIDEPREVFREASHHQEPLNPPAHKISPEAIIPLDDDDFKDF